MAKPTEVAILVADLPRFVKRAFYSRLLYRVYLLLGRAVGSEALTPEIYHSVKNHEKGLNALWEFAARDKFPSGTHFDWMFDIHLLAENKNSAIPVHFASGVKALTSALLAHEGEMSNQQLSGALEYLCETRGLWDSIESDAENLSHASTTPGISDSTVFDHWQWLGPLDWRDSTTSSVASIGVENYGRILGRPFLAADCFPWHYSGAAREPNRLALNIEIPDHLSDEEIDDYLLELTSRIDSMHRALGGSGIKLSDLEFFGSPVFAEVPR